MKFIFASIVANIIAAATVTCLTVSVHAASIRGIVTIESSKVFFLPFNDPKETRAAIKPLPIVTSIDVRTSLLDLNSGDFAVLSGLLEDVDGDGKPDQIDVSAIESVGLQNILGTWKSQNWQVVRFEDFSKMSLYRAKLRAPDHLMNLSKFKTLNYTLAPDQGSSYSIFLVEKGPALGPGAVYVGRLEVIKTEAKPSLRLEIFDPKTGAASDTLSLSPIRD